MPDQERCVCGDPLCPRCFPYYVEEDEDDAYERSKSEAMEEEPRSSSRIER